MKTKAISSVFSFARYMLPLIVLAFFGAITDVQAEQHKVQWQAAIGMNQEQSRQAQQSGDSLARRMQPLEVTAQVNKGRVELAGRGSLDQLRTAIFDTVGEWADFLGGPVELTLTLAETTTPVTLHLESRITTGYGWEIVAEPGMRFVQQGAFSSTSRYKAYGAPAIQTVVLHPGHSGNSTIRLIYRRPFEKDQPINTRLNVSISGNIGVIELFDPTPLIPESRKTSATEEITDPFAELDSTRVLPSAWDWRTASPQIIPAVRDQGPCGSCWAFGTVGVMESAVRKSGGPLTDLSEQFLVSCNKDNWGCHGGLTANKYHHNTLAKNQTTIGAVLESVKPYTQSDGSCAVNYNHPYQLSNWRFITGSEWTMPSNLQIKNAIYTYGPITAGVCVDVGWYSYTGGMYSSSSNVCGGYTNHQIILVGWNDATQTWILRNSWGSSWGDKGYMHIKYDPHGSTSRVGEGTSWVKYQSAQPQPTVITPMISLLLGESPSKTQPFRFGPLNDTGITLDGN